LELFLSRLDALIARCRMKSPDIAGLRTDSKSLR
jgi:hypothetical protein